MIEREQVTAGSLCGDHIGRETGRGQIVRITHRRSGPGNTSSIVELWLQRPDVLAHDGTRGSRSSVELHESTNPIILLPRTY